MARWLGVVVLGSVFLVVAVGAGAGAGKRGAVAISGAAQYAMSPVVAVDRRGDQTVVWTDYRVRSQLAEFAVMTASRRVGGRGWSAPENVSGWRTSIDGEALALDASGGGVIAWVAPVRTRHGERTALIAMTRRSGSAGWGRAVPVATGRSYLAGVSAGIDSGGRVTVIWSVDRTAGSYEQRVNPPIYDASATLRAERWSKPGLLASQGGINSQLAVNGRGDTVVTWQRQVGRVSNPDGGGVVVPYLQMARYRPASGTWHPAVIVARFPQPTPAIGANEWAPTPQTTALDPHGGASITWASYKGSSDTVFVAHRSASAPAWKRSRLWTGQSSTPELAADGTGAVTVAWTTEKDTMIEAKSNHGESWTTPQQVPGVSHALIAWLSVDPRGEAIVTWSAPHSRVLAITQPQATGRWTHPTVIGQGYFPQAAIDGRGQAAIVWPSHPRHKFAQRIYATTYPAH